MARKVNILLVDDLDNTEIEDGKGGTVSFGLDGTAYEIDLSEKNADKLRKAMEKFVEAARKVGKAPKPGRSNVTSISSARSANAAARMDKEQSTAIREWAKKNGHEVSDRGRIPNAIVEAFQTANG